MATAQITVRNVDPVLKKRIARAARLNDQSINDFMLDAARSKVGLKTSRPITEHPWKQFVGTMPDNAINLTAIEQMDQIDQSMWS